MFFFQLGLLGKLRLLGAKVLEEAGVAVRNMQKFNFLWVVDFPLFEKDMETGKLVSVHHPFTLPREEDISYIYTDPLKVCVCAKSSVLGDEINKNVIILVFNIIIIIF